MFDAQLKQSNPIYFLVFLIFLLPTFGQAQGGMDFPVQNDWGNLFPEMDKEENSIFGFSPDVSKRNALSRRIEPTSPILGHQVVQLIKTHGGHPTEIIDTLHQAFPKLQFELAVSSIAYFNTLMPGLMRYNEMMWSSTKPSSGQVWTEVEPAAIPLEVLLPLYPQYAEELENALEFAYTGSEASLLDSAISVSVKYGNDKVRGAGMIEMLKPDGFYAKYLPNKLAKLVKLNARISSAESAYPRVQHSLNGYSQYVYDYMLNHRDLEGLLYVTYQAQKRWIEGATTEANELPFLSSIEKAIIGAGYSHRDALLTLCYSTRNMPNLDVQYARDSERSLALEVYFWKLKEIQNRAIQNHFDQVFPNHIFNENPMLYHYATASYLAYEVTRSGYRNGTAIGMAFLSKLGYKAHKFTHAIDGHDIAHNGFAVIAKVLKEQSSMAGIAAGYFGGLHGVSMGKMQDRTKLAVDRTNELAVVTAKSQ